MNLRSVLFVSALAVAGAANADVLFTFESLTAPSGTSTTFGPYNAESGTGTASILHASASTYSTPAGNGSSKALSSNTWAMGDYYQFAVSTLGISKVGFSFDQAGSSTGPANFNVAYSLNGSSFTTLAGSDYTLGSSSFSSGTANTALTRTFDFSGISAVSNQSTVYFRIVDTSNVAINGSTVATAGTDRVDNVSVATYQPVPEPSAFAALGLGALALVRRRRSTK